MKKTLLILGFFTLAACGRETEIQKNFRTGMEQGCYKAALNAGGQLEAVKKYCDCIAKKISSTLSDQEIMKMEEGIKDGSDASGDLEKKIKDLQSSAVEECRG